MFVEHIADEAAKVPVHSPENLYKSFYFLYKFSKNIGMFPEVYEEIGVINRHSIGLFSRPLKSQFLRDIVLTHYLAYFLEHAPKSFHCSFEVIGRCRQKNVHSISHHTFIKVAARSVI